jgi:hypothetical protein
MTSYRVTIRYQFPSWNETDGIGYTVEALSKSDAIKQVRRQATRDGHIGNVVGKGRITLSATEEPSHVEG